MYAWYWPPNLASSFSSSVRVRTTSSPMITLPATNRNQFAAISDIPSTKSATES